MKKIILISCLIVSSILIFYTCDKDKTDATSDSTLYKEITATGYTYFKNGDILPRIPESPHGAFKLRFNSIALSALDNNGVFPEGASFPTGSILVKEVISNNNISLYAIMKKDPSNGNAGNGWVWAELNTDGSTAFSAGRKGNGCISCHSISPNRDLTRTFNLHQ